APSRWWDGSDKAFTASDVAAIANRVWRRRTNGDGLPFAIEPARDVGECLHGTYGRAIRIRARES
ncbi:MAG TPA: hypothetical protein VIL25_08880, partial [Vicinamibacterales bacterium]